jgi:hypothetical protein
VQIATGALGVLTITGTGIFVSIVNGGEETPSGWLLPIDSVRAVGDALADRRST